MNASKTKLINPILDFWVKIPQNFPLDDWKLRNSSQFKLRSERYPRIIKNSFSELITEKSFVQLKYQSNNLAHLEILQIKSNPSESDSISLAQVIEMKNEYLTGKKDLSKYLMRVLYNLLMKTPDVMLGFHGMLLIPIKSSIPIRLSEGEKYLGLYTYLQNYPGFQSAQVWNFTSIENPIFYYSSCYVAILSQ